MHTLLILFSLALALVGSGICRRLLPRARAWDSRRAVQLAGLLLPALVLSVLAAVMAHFLSQICFLTAPPADVTLASGLSLMGALGLTTALGWNGVRALATPWYFERRTWAAPGWLQERVQALGGELAVRRIPAARVAADAQPWALVVGPWRPRLILSSGLVGLLDAAELDAVLCHELAHVQRGDLGWSLLAGILRDLSWFLPTSRRLYALLRTDQELACDDRVPGAARRLALASALARVWQAGTPAPRTPAGALTLLTPGQAALCERRVRRLLTVPAPRRSRKRSAVLPVLGGVFGLLLLLQGAATFWTMTQVGCNLMELGLLAGGMR